MAVEGFAHEFRVSVRWLAEQMRRAGFAVEEVRARNVTMRAVGRVVRDAVAPRSTTRATRSTGCCASCRASSRSARSA